MAGRDDDRNSNPGLTSAGRETRERVARNGGEALHGNDGRRSSGSRRGGRD